jgi:hypothetical protein
MRVELVGTSAIVKIRLSVNDGAIRQRNQVGERPFHVKRNVIIIF